MKAMPWSNGVATYNVIWTQPVICKPGCTGVVVVLVPVRRLNTLWEDALVQLTGAVAQALECNNSGCRVARMDAEGRWLAMVSWDRLFFMTQIPVWKFRKELLKDEGDAVEQRCRDLQRDLRTQPVICKCFCCLRGR